MLTFALAAAAFLGLVEGFTEFLPISSTAHLILASDLLHLPQSDYLKTFEIAIQSGAILAVLVLYWKKFLDWEVLKRIFVAFLPTAVLGLIFYHFIKTYLLGNTAVVLFALGLGGILLIVFEKFVHTKNNITDMKDISYKNAFVIGIAQSVAMIPGISRAAATIVGGMLLGVERSLIVEFSFLLAVPTMLAATGLDLVKNIHAFSVSELHLLGIGFLISFIAALVSIKFLLHYIRTHTFTSFGVYRIILVIVFLFILLI